MAHIARAATLVHLAWPRGATARPRPGQNPGGPHAQEAVAGRSYPASEVRGSSRECQAATAQEQLRGTTPHPRSGAAARRSYPASEMTFSIILIFILDLS